MLDEDAGTKHLMPSTRARFLFQFEDIYDIFMSVSVTITQFSAVHTFIFGRFFRFSPIAVPLNKALAFRFHYDKAQTLIYNFIRRL